MLLLFFKVAGVFVVFCPLIITQIESIVWKLTSFQRELRIVAFKYTAISRKVVGKHVHATIPKSNMGYDQYTVPDTVAVEPTFAAFL